MNSFKVVLSSFSLLFLVFFLTYPCNAYTVLGTPSTMPDNIEDSKYQRYGSLNIYSEIPGVEIYIDGTLRGRDMIKIDKIQVGSHLIKALGGDRVVYSEIVKVEEGALSTIIINEKGAPPSDRTIVEPESTKEYKPTIAEKVPLFTKSALYDFGLGYMSGSTDFDASPYYLHIGGIYNYGGSTFWGFNFNYTDRNINSSSLLAYCSRYKTYGLSLSISNCIINTPNNPYMYIGASALILKNYFDKSTDFFSLYSSPYRWDCNIKYTPDDIILGISPHIGILVPANNYYWKVNLSYNIYTLKVIQSLTIDEYIWSSYWGRYVYNNTSTTSASKDFNCNSIILNVGTCF